MAFLNKLGDLTKNVGEKASELTKNIGDKTNDIMENNRANARISSEKKRIAEYKSRIGDAYYRKFAEGSIRDPDADELCALIAESEKTIAALEGEIEARRAEKEARREAAKEEAEERREKRGFTSGRCPKCGLLLDEGVSVCPRCGAGGDKEEAQPPIQPDAASDSRMCQACGAAIPDGARFCPECGAGCTAPGLAEAAESPNRVCPVCGEESPSDMRFCPQCGTKLG